MLKERNQQLSLFQYQQNIYLGTELQFLDNSDRDIRQNIRDINLFIEGNKDKLTEKHQKIILTFMVHRMAPQIQSNQLEILYSLSYFWVMVTQAINSPYEDIHLIALKFLNQLTLKQGYDGKFTGTVVKFKFFQRVLNIMTSITLKEVYIQSLWVLSAVLKNLPNYTKRVLQNQLAMKKTFDFFQDLNAENINENNSFFYFISKLLFNFTNCKIQINPMIQIELYKKVIESVPIISFNKTDVLLKRQWLQCILQFSNNQKNQDICIQDGINNLVLQILEVNTDYCIMMQCITILRNLIFNCSDFIKQRVFPTVYQIEKYLKILSPNFESINLSPTDFRVLIQLMDSIVMITSQQNDNENEEKKLSQQQFQLDLPDDQKNRLMSIEECRVFQTSGFQLKLCKFIMYHPSVQIRKRGFALLLKHLERVPKESKFFDLLQNKIFHIPKHYYDKKDSQMYYHSLLIIKDIIQFRNQSPQICQKVEKVMVEQQYFDILQYYQDSKDLKVCELVYQIKNIIEGL